MKGIIKVILRKIISGCILILTNFKVGRYCLDMVLNSIMNRKKEVEHQGFKFLFSTPNQLNEFRAASFATKEPETLEWIDNIPKQSVFWDIGANIGLYSCYAAKARECEVFAFEPSIFNLELLARNIYQNNLVGKVIIVPLPLSDSLKVSTLNMTTTDWGGALSTFGENYGDDGKPLNQIFQFSSVGLSIDQSAQLLNIPKPEYIKLDVDGLEHLILAGGRDILRNVLGMSIEVNEDFSAQASGVEKICNEAGLIFKEKRHSELFEDNARWMNTYNQIWHRG
jgi:FkbM family methyltransferase